MVTRFAGKEAPRREPTLTTESYSRRYELLWVAALGLLVLNDHVLKGSGLLPGVVTGKLSDVAGLVVAPVLAAAVATVAGLPRARSVGFAAVVLPFVAINVSVEAAQSVERALLPLGIDWKIWTDPSDLLALAVLPLAWRTASAVERDMENVWRVRYTVAAALGGLACLATSTEYLRFQTSSYLVSAAHEPVTVQVFRLRTPTACPVPAPELSGSDFEAEFCERLLPGWALPLDRDFTCSSDCGSTSPEPACDAVVLRVRGMRDTIVSFSASGNEEVIREDESRGGLDPRAVILEPFGDALVIAGSTALEAAPFEGNLAAVDCRELPDLEGVRPEPLGVGEGGAGGVANLP